MSNLRNIIHPGNLRGFWYKKERCLVIGKQGGGGIKR
jgi:hypothetical protein